VEATVPEHELAARVVSDPLSPAMLAPMYGFCAGICALSATDVSDTSPLVTATHEVIRSTLRLIASLGDPEDPPLYSAAVRVALDSYSDRTCNTALIARRLRVSDRSLQLAFQAKGTTVSAMLRGVRSAAAKRIMREQPRLTKVRVAELAGFGSVDALDRALRAA